MLQDNGEIVTEDETEENEMPPLEDVEDEEYSPWGIDFSSYESFECASKGRQSTAIGKHFSILGAMFKTKYVACRDGNGHHPQ